MRRILGVDPGTGILGFGVIDGKGQRCRLVTGGVIKTPVKTPTADRLMEIYKGLNEIIDETKPQVMAVERLFFNQNITTGISVAEARGVVLLIGKQRGLEIFEYTPLQIKQTLTGYGRADKKQMQETVRVILKLAQPPKPDDAADALAAAITHQFMNQI